jgi:flap endonuclease-1
LLSEGIKLIYVFDGFAPDLKEKTHENRKNARDLAKERYHLAKQKEDFESMKRYSSQNIRLTAEMIEESKELLRAMGISVVQSPGEGEAQAAHLCRTRKEIYASASQDYDSLLFGASKLIQNLTLSRKRKTISGYVEIKPALIELEKVLNSLEINLDQLICLGILVGTDYNPRGIPGIGQKKALEIVKKYKLPIFIFESVNEQILGLPEEDRFDWKEIFQMFHKPEVIEPEILSEKLDKEKVKEILVSRHNFSEERITEHLHRLEESFEKNKQKALDKWF